jgi:hypothetical protein
VTESLQPGRVSHHLRRNPVFLASAAFLVFAPSLVVFFGPTITSAFGFGFWLGAGWFAGLLGLLIGDEALHHEEKKVLGPSRTKHLFHRLIKDPMFLITLAIVVLAPPAISYFGPPILPDSPDWAWLIVALLVAVAAAYMGYRALTNEEEKQIAPTF